MSLQYRWIVFLLPRWTSAIELIIINNIDWEDNIKFHTHVGDIEAEQSCRECTSRMWLTIDGPAPVHEFQA